MGLPEAAHTTIIKRMLKLVGFFLLLLPFKVACSQPEDLALLALRQKLVGHRFILRNFSAQTLTHYHYQDMHLEQDAPPLIISAALFEVKDAVLHGTLITLRGQRSVLVEDAGTSQVSVAPQIVDASIQVEFGANYVASALSQLADELFFPSLTSALAAVPPYLRSAVPYRINVQRKQPCKDCKHWMRQGTWQELPANDSGLKNPQILRSESADNPPMTGETITRATASFAFVVDERGHTSELWLTRPAGHGLDEFWTLVLRKQVFWPAKYHGTAVAVPLAQDFDYQRF